MKNNTYDGYQQLAVAIIGQAVEDYTWAINDLDGESLIDAIRKEMYKKPRVIKRMESK